MDSYFYLTVACSVDNNCGLNARCESDNHKAVCFCRDGFQGDPLTGCTNINFCADDPCGFGARCSNRRGTFRCSCPLGTVGNPLDEGCSTPVECLSNTDCPTSAFCGEEHNEPKCKNACEDNASQCGPNAECVADDHMGKCNCRSGYEGEPSNPLIGCRPKVVPCRKNADCPPATICDGGLCRRKYNTKLFIVDLNNFLLIM